MSIGRSYFILYPGKAGASSVSITSIKDLTIYTDYSALGATAMELPDEEVEIALKVAEIVALARRRKPSRLKEMIQTVMTGIKARKYVFKS